MMRRMVELDEDQLKFQIIKNMKLDVTVYRCDFDRLSEVKLHIKNRDFIYDDGHSYYVYKNKRLVSQGEGSYV